jgi:hypothetical protein
MSGVTRWNAVIMLAPTDSGTDIEQVLGMFDAVDDIVIQEGTYTFSGSRWTQRSAYHMDRTSYTFGVSEVYYT